MLRISQLFTYPIKSLGGVALNSAMVTDRGLEHDRRWMLVDVNNRFMTQRERASMALFQPSLSPAGLRIDHPGTEPLVVPFDAPAIREVTVQIWNDVCHAELVSETADEWFSDLLSMECRLVRMPDSARRAVDRHHTEGPITSFSDDYPFLLIGQSSLDDLNSRLRLTVPVNRFRPNIVFTGGVPFEEDRLAHFRIGEVDFYGVKLCARCGVITIDQSNAHKGREPLATLAKYRTRNKRVLFGQNLIHRGNGLLHVGDTLDVIETSDSIQ